MENLFLFLLVGGAVVLLAVHRAFEGMVCSEDAPNLPLRKFLWDAGTGMGVLLLVVGGVVAARVLPAVGDIVGPVFLLMAPIAVLCTAIFVYLSYVVYRRKVDETTHS